MEDKNKFDMVIDKFLELSKDGKVDLDKKIYSENRLSNLLHYSRSSIREIYAALRLIGVLECRRGEGSYLSFSNFDNLSKVFLLKMILEDGKVQDIMQVRNILELSAVRTCAQDNSEEEIKSLEECLENMRKFRDPTLNAREDVKFHSIILMSNKNVLLELLYNILSGLLEELTTKNWRTILMRKQDDFDIIMKQHEEVLQGIKVKNPELAESALKNHLLFVSKKLEFKIDSFFTEDYCDQN